MLVRNTIIQTALLKLGEVSSYSDNRSEEYRIADILLDNVIKNVAVRNDFLFNSKTIQLTLRLTSHGGKDPITGEYVFNLPSDFANKISFIDSVDARLEGEFAYSTEDNLKLQYCRKISLEEMPDYMFNYLVYALATEMAETYSSYISRLTTLNTRLEQERQNIYRIEYQYKRRVM